MKQIASSLCARAVYSTHLKLNGWLRSPLTYIVYVHHKLPTTISTNTCKLSNDRKNRKLYRVECRVYDACNLVSGKYGEYVIYNCTHNRNTKKEEKSKNPRDTQSKHNRPYESACCTVCVCACVGTATIKSNASQLKSIVICAYGFWLSQKLQPHRYFNFQTCVHTYIWFVLRMENSIECISTKDEANEATEPTEHRLIQRHLWWYISIYVHNNTPNRFGGQMISCCTKLKLR